MMQCNYITPASVVSSKLVPIVPKSVAYLLKTETIIIL